MRRFQILPLVLAVTWLPYTALRCVEDPLTHAGCSVLVLALQMRSSNHDAHQHSDAATHPEHGTRKHGMPRTCCDITGKCDVEMTAGSAPTGPLAPAIATTWPFAEPIAPRAQTPHGCQTTPVAHAPPIFLRNATLLI